MSLATGCWWSGPPPEPLAAPPDPLAAVRRLVPIPVVVTYIEDRESDGERSTFEVEERWYHPSPDQPGDVYKLVTTRHDPKTDRNTFSMELVIFDAAGFAHFASPPVDGPPMAEPVQFEPPMIVLPVNPKPGTTWSTVHTKAGKSWTRSCRLETASQCPGGVISHCELFHTYRVTVRDTFCPGVGIVDEVTETRDPQRNELVIARTSTRSWSRKLEAGAARAD